MEGIEEHIVTKKLLSYDERKEKMRNDVKLLFENLQKIDEYKLEHIDEATKIQEKINNIVNDFINEHHEEYDVMRSFKYVSNSKKFVSIIEIEQKVIGVSLHSICITFGLTPQDFDIKHIIHV